MEEQITWINYMGTGQPKTITVYPFTAEIVNDLVFDIIPHINYSKSGVYHFSNEGVCSWFDFTKMIAKYAGNTGSIFSPATAMSSLVL